MQSRLKATGRVPAAAVQSSLPQWTEALERGKMDEYGFILDDAETDEFLHAGEFYSSKRRECWRTMLDKWEDVPAYKRRAKIEKGIPHEFRSRAWQTLSNQQRQRGFYENLCNREDNKAVYQIKLDLNRTFATHIHFKEEGSQGCRQTDLLNVLKAYAHYNPAIGYCQGMSYMAATLLMVMSPEDAFWTFVWMMERMENVHDPKMSGFMRNAQLLEKLIALECPRLSSHLDQHGVVPVLFCTPWFVAFFTNLKCWATVLRIFDLFFLEGSAALLRYSLAFLKLSEAELLARHSLEGLLTFLHNFPHWVIHPDVASEAANKLNIAALLHRASTFALPPRTPVAKKPRTAAATRPALPPPSPSLFTQLMTPIRRSAFLRDFLPHSPPGVTASVTAPAAAAASVKSPVAAPPSARPARSPLSPLSPNARPPSNRAAKKRNSPLSPIIAKENPGSGGSKRRRGPASPLTPQTPHMKKAARLPQLELVEDEEDIPNEEFHSPAFKEFSTPRKVGSKRSASALNIATTPNNKSAVLSPPSPVGVELSEIRTYDV